TALLLICAPLMFLGCASMQKDQVTDRSSRKLIGISDGLPDKGLWRESLALYDMNGDGFLDIVAPPPRKPEKGQNRPFIFLFDAAGRKWTGDKYVFPEGYVYGGIAAGDINGDGRPDVALAQHAGKVTLFFCDKDNRFVESPMPVQGEFHSRAVVLSDINNDGRTDVVALSEAKFSSAFTPRGILCAINKGNNDWDIRMLEDRSGLFGDSLSIGDLNADGTKDIAVALMTSTRELQKLIWFGDGKGDFKNYTGDLFGGDSAVPMIVRTGNVDVTAGDEAVFGLALIGGGEKEKGRISVEKWTGDAFKDISSGLNLGYLVAFDLVDIDGDGRSELVVLTDQGMHICKYDVNSGWKVLEHFPIPMSDVSNVTDLRAGRNKDGSLIIVFNLGKYESEGLNRGIKAFILK
ncbi:MAG TPA: VCBS repeat-containing protein, partial [Thermodesulfovibrionales bacterium]|nr:VCBS repeat-containing protein [Thermodesulfovibrionales bacterium]